MVPGGCVWGTEGKRPDHLPFGDEPLPHHELDRRVRVWERLRRARPRNVAFRT